MQMTPGGEEVTLDVVCA